MSNTEFQGNPESGIDRFLNESAQASNAQLVSAVETRQATVEEQAKQIIDLHADLASMTASRNNWEERARLAEANLNRAKVYWEDYLSGHIDPQEVIDEHKELMDIVGFEATRTVQVRLTVSWTGSIELPYGTDVSDIDIDDFTDLPNRIDHSEFDSYIDWEDGEIEER